MQDSARDGPDSTDSGTDIRDGVGGVEEALGDILGLGIASVEGGRGLWDNALRDGVGGVIEAGTDGREK